MSERLDDILDEALTALAAGEPPEQILARFPDAAGDLRPLLRIAAALPALRIEPRPVAQERGRRAFLIEARSISPRPQAGARPSIFSGLARVIGVIILFLGIVVAPVAASGSALPGEPLYGLKRTVESARLLLALDPAMRQQLADSFQQERLREIWALMARGDSARVEWAGTLELTAPNAWKVAGVPIVIGSTTHVTGELRDGLSVWVTGQVDNGSLIADEITVLGSPPLQPTLAAPEPTLEETSHPTETLEPEIHNTAEPKLTETEEPSGGDDSGKDGGGDDGDSGSLP